MWLSPHDHKPENTEIHLRRCQWGPQFSSKVPLGFDLVNWMSLVTTFSLHKVSMLAGFFSRGDVSNITWGSVIFVPVFFFYSNMGGLIQGFSLALKMCRRLLQAVPGCFGVEDGPICGTWSSEVSSVPSKPCHIKMLWVWKSYLLIKQNYQW